MPLPLETERLTIRRFEMDDAPAFAAYRSDPDVARYQGWNAPYSQEQAAAFVRAMRRVKPGAPGKWLQLALQVKATGELAGDCAFNLHKDDPRQATIGLTLARPFQGQGYGHEAMTRLLDYLFFELKLHRVRADCDVLNQAAFSSLEKLGLRREAHFVESLWFKSGWASEYWYAILEREWAGRRKLAS
jgi:aminoglycoside 6'-N-acetyltransferase